MLYGNFALVLLNAFVAAAPATTASPDFTYPFPKDVTQVWAGFDPRALPLDIEVKEELKEGGATIQRLYFTGEIVNGVPVRIYAITGVPNEGSSLPGIMHMHGGGQTASMEWVRYWSQRGFAVVSFDWCGEVKSRQDYTKWGAVKANMMIDGQAHTTPDIRTSPWFHWALVSRRVLTLLEQLPRVDKNRLGIFGVSMGGHNTWIIAGSDPRVRAAVPIYGCGWNTYPDVHSGGGYKHPVPPEVDLWRGTMEPEVYARYITCPMLLLSATNDFHTHMDRCYDSLARVQAPTLQSFTPRYSHHLEKEQGRTLERWMKWKLQGDAAFPDSPKITLAVRDHHLEASIAPASPDRVTSVQAFSYEGTKRPQTRFWRTLSTAKQGTTWTAGVPVFAGEPIRVFANVTYQSGETLSSNEAIVEPANLQDVAKNKTTLAIDDFKSGVDDWTYGPAYTDPYIDWSYLQSTDGPAGSKAVTLSPQAASGQYVIGTHKVGDVSCPAPDKANFSFQVRTSPGTELTVHVLVDQWGPQSKDYEAKVKVAGSDAWQAVTLTPSECHLKDGASLSTFRSADRIEFVGTYPAGKPPAFAQVRWIEATQ